MNCIYCGDERFFSLGVLGAHEWLRCRACHGVQQGDEVELSQFNYDEAHGKEDER